MWLPIGGLRWCSANMFRVYQQSSIAWLGFLPSREGVPLVNPPENINDVSRFQIDVAILEVVKNQLWRWRKLKGGRAVETQPLSPLNVWKVLSWTNWISRENLERAQGLISATPGPSVSAGTHEPISILHDPGQCKHSQHRVVLVRRRNTCQIWYHTPSKTQRLGHKNG